MSNAGLTAALNGHRGCRCHDAAALMRADIDGSPSPRDTCPTHSSTGRDATEKRVRIEALAELARKTRVETDQAIALNSPKLTDRVRAALEAPIEGDTTA